MILHDAADPEGRHDQRGRRVFGAQGTTAVIPRAGPGVTARLDGGGDLVFAQAQRQRRGRLLPGAGDNLLGDGAIHLVDIGVIAGIIIVILCGRIADGAIPGVQEEALRRRPRDLQCDARVRGGGVQVFIGHGYLLAHWLGNWLGREGAHSITPRSCKARCRLAQGS